MGRKEKTMNAYAKEYLDIMPKLRVLFKKMKHYNGSAEHMETLEKCIENGKKLYSGRGILSEKQITQNFGCIREMIINRQKVAKRLEYLEQCIEAEKKFLDSCELEEETIEGLISIMQFYETAADNGNENTDEMWEQIIKIQGDTINSILKKMDHNELSHSIHKKPIVATLQVVVEGIEEHQKGLSA